jgi:hypothetical protein
VKNIADYKRLRADNLLLKMLNQNGPREISDKLCGCKEKWTTVIGSYAGQIRVRSRARKFGCFIT